jgi:hypothetical protein
LAEHLTTKSGDNLLQTGGMIYVQALANGKELTLQKPMEIVFSSVESKLKGMQLFTGERKMENKGAMNWQPLTTKNEDYTHINTETVYLDYYCSAVQKRLETMAPMRYILDLTDTDSLLEEFPIVAKVVNPKLRYFPRSTSFTGHSMGVYACEHLDFDWKTKLDIHKKAFKDVYDFYKADTYDALQKQDTSLWDKQYRKKIGKKKEEKRLKDSIELETQRKDAVDYAEWRQKTDSLDIEMQRKNAIDYAEFQRRNEMSIAINNAFPIVRLGWVNCDRYLNYPEKLLVTISINDNQSTSFDAKLLIKQDKVIVNGSNIIGQKLAFNKIVRGAAAVVVAMKIENGQSYLAMHDFITSAEPIDLKFEALSPEQIKERLKKLN